MSIRIGILGYGNLGRGVECAIRQNPDMELAAVFTRRDPKTVSIQTEGVPVCKIEEAFHWKDKIDVLILCGGSATDLPVQTPEFAGYFHVIDSFDTHAKIPEHFAAVDAEAKKSGKVGIISCGWDPGMFSLNRLYANAILPQGKDYTFWGKGVSQGHSDAVRRIEGVADARQYTIPVKEALDSVRAGENPDLTTRQKHTRECFVVLEEGATFEAVKAAIQADPYFSHDPLDVRQVTKDELPRVADASHGVLMERVGASGLTANQHFTFDMRIDNPALTAQVLVSSARAAVRLAQSGRSGAYTLIDVPPVLLLPGERIDNIGRLV